MEQQAYLKNQSGAFQVTVKTLLDCQRVMPGLVSSVRVEPEGLVLRTTPDKLRPLALFLRNNSLLRFTFLIEIAAVDSMRAVSRFTLNYFFLSACNQRVIVQLYADETLAIPSLTRVFNNGERLFSAAN